VGRHTPPYRLRRCSTIIFSFRSQNILDPLRTKSYWRLWPTPPHRCRASIRTLNGVASGPRCKLGFDLKRRIASRASPLRLTIRPSKPLTRAHDCRKPCRQAHASRFHLGPRFDPAWNFSPRHRTGRTRIAHCQRRQTWIYALLGGTTAGRQPFVWLPTAELAGVLNNLPGLWFTGVTPNVPKLHSADIPVSGVSPELSESNAARTISNSGCW
jgi:hypothetical protein